MNNTNETTRNIHIGRFSILTDLRAMVPEHQQLHYLEAMNLAERQAQRLRELLAVTGPGMPTWLLTNFPRIQVIYRRDFPSSGAAQWSRGRWLVFLNAGDPYQRQRFSLAHELFHIINYWKGAQLHPGDGRVSARTQAERLADYFAGCLLMPEQEVRRLVNQGVPTETLGSWFQVSNRAMAVRLSQLGMSEPQPRCATPTHLEARREVAA